MGQFSITEAARLREEAEQCRALARFISLKVEARRLLDMAKACEDRAAALEIRILGAGQLQAA